MGKSYIAVEAGRRIRSAREAKGLSREDVTSLLGWENASGSPTRISNYENGQRMINVPEAMRLAELLGVTAGYLLTIDKESTNKAMDDLVAAAKDLDPDQVLAIVNIVRAMKGGTKLSRTSQHDHPDRISLDGKKKTPREDDKQNEG